MNILFIDTSLDKCIVALEHKKSLFSKESKEPGQHTKNLNALIIGVLDEARIGLEDISSIVVTNGPGSFTGIRVGMSCAYAINALYNTKVFAISTLEIFACMQKGEVVVSANAGRKRVYIQRFSESKEPISEIVLMHLDDVQKEYRKKVHGSYSKEEYSAQDFVNAFYYLKHRLELNEQLPLPIYSSSYT